MDTEYEPTKESHLGTIVRLTEELTAIKQERDAALTETREMRDCRQREHDMRVKLAGELERAKDEAWRMRRHLEFAHNAAVWYADKLDLIYTYPILYGAAIELARAEREEVGHE